MIIGDVFTDGGVINIIGTFLNNDKLNQMME